MHWVAAVAMVALCVLLERTWVLVVRENAGGHVLFRAVRGRILLQDTQGALQLCSGRGAVAQVMRAGLMAGVDRHRARRAVRETQLACMPRLTHRIGALSSLASLAALCGLLGTVEGMVGGTHCIATASANQRSAAVGMQVANALNTTGFVILVALALLGAAIVLRARRDRLVSEIELYGAAVVNLVGVATEPDALAPVHVYRGLTP